MSWDRAVASSHLTSACSIGVLLFQAACSRWHLACTWAASSFADIPLLPPEMVVADH
eukprot:CAMPEP_0114621042 /NCGR_PEP_ID=MMETSP0168-20121206/9031_1 /TAXON_ID=95228 ORGANISM="Vannella sp., Strain DIVA3 517/6/12" /NCGR_SAMPLE_ID=MMETSP0168 /ASSEMBLY_ACC=CAM_ASM_000044 /LENGTH=56 /DNA_ID=CAMNT_0001832241 /DNA_START=448 /DNA_END=618 /DNA_ORIENTATION=+